MKSKKFFALLTLSALLTLCLTAAAGAAKPAVRKEQQTANASIAGDKVNVRKKPNMSSQVVKQLNAGHPVAIIRQDGDWYLIRTASGTEGWVFGEYVALGESAAQKKTKTSSKAMSDEEFIKLCTSGTAQQVANAIKAGANVNTKDKDGWPALSLALWRNTSEVVIALINAGADVNAKDEYGTTALMLAAREQGNPIEIISALLKAGADVNAKDNQGMTALIWAAELNFNPEVITTLLNAGADINARDNEGWTALDHAWSSYNDSVAERLEAAAKNPTPAMSGGVNKNQYERVNYSDVARYPERYRGKRISFSGRVLTILDDGFSILQNNSSSQSWWATHQRQQGEGRILRDDSITVYGVGNGIGKYHDPAIRVDFFELE